MELSTQCLCLQRLLEVAEDAAARLDLSETGARTVHFFGQGVEEPEDGCHYFGGRLGRAFRPRGGKQLVEISGRPMLTWSIAAFDAVEDGWRNRGGVLERAHCRISQLPVTHTRL